MNHPTTTIHGRTGELVSFPENQTGISVGTHVFWVIHLHGQQTRRGDIRMVSLLDIRCIGYCLVSHPNAQIGQWSTGNASSGLSNIENNDTYWDWSFQK